MGGYDGRRALIILACIPSFVGGIANALLNRLEKS